MRLPSRAILLHWTPDGYDLTDAQRRDLFVHLRIEPPIAPE